MNELSWEPELFLNSPFFAPIKPFGAALAGGDFPTLGQLNELVIQQLEPIVTTTGLPLRFVAQQYGKLPFELQYEPRCYLSGEVPSRENNWHDLFNALVWLAYPKTKAAINQRHYQALTSVPDPSSQRGVVRDVNTLFDESGIVVVSSQMYLLDLLKEFQWQELFCKNRKQVSKQMGFYIFGHGLFEKALNPYVGMTGQGYLLTVPEAFFQQSYTQQLAVLDQLLANKLLEEAEGHSTRDLSPVPILGIPGWWAENEDVSFYQNKHYFRPGRRNKN